MHLKESLQGPAGGQGDKAGRLPKDCCHPGSGRNWVKETCPTGPGFNPCLSLQIALEIVHLSSPMETGHSLVVHVLSEQQISRVRMWDSLESRKPSSLPLPHLLVKLVWKMGAGLQISKKLKIQSCGLGESRAFLDIDAVIRSTLSEPSTLRNPWPPVEGILCFCARL